MKSVKLRQNRGIVGDTLLCGTLRCSPGADSLTTNSNVSLVVGQGMIVGVTPDLQNISRRFLLVTSILQEGGSGRSEEASQFDEDGLQRYRRGGIHTDDPKLTKVKEMSQN